VGGIEYHSLPPALSYQRICFKMQKISDLLYVRKNFLNEFDKETHPAPINRDTPLFIGEFCKSPLVPPDKCHSHESGNPVEIRDCGFPIPDISRKKKEMNIKMKKGNKMKTRPFKIIILLLGMSLFFSSLIFAGPNENAGIVFDLDAETYGNQNLTSIPSQPAGTYIRLDVYCTGVQNLDTYEFNVIYDPTELAYVVASASNMVTLEPNILTTNGGTAIGWMIDTSTPGVLSLAYTLAGTDPAQAPEGEGLIGDIVLQALTPSRDLLTFGDVLFIDSFGVMDIITNKGVALLSHYGNIDGTVTDANNSEPIEDALITATSQGKFEYTGFTNADGYYIIDSLIAVIAGNYTVICDAADQGYNITYAYNVETIADDTTNVDFALTSPIMVVAPLEICPIVEDMGDSIITDITISNIGTGPLGWHRTFIVDPEQLIEPFKIEFPIPPSSNYYTPIKVASSLGFPPEIIHTNHSEPVVNLTRGSTAWAYDIYPGEYFFSFDTDTPGTANIISSSPNWSSYAGDFDSGSDDDATYYIIRYSNHILACVDIETGIATDIGPVIGSGGSYAWTGISCDKSTGIMYAVETDLNFTNLYTIDLATGTPTIIGATGIPCVIDIAVDGEGIIWGYDIIGDNMYTIDPTTAVGTMVGPIGFNANYSQGMSWDPVTDQVYLTAYGSNSGTFRVLNRETGYCAYVGPLPGNNCVTSLGFIGVPWITVEPISGTIEPGGNEIVQATVYWLESLFPGQVQYADIVFTSDPNCGEQTVNVTATFGTDIPGSISGLVTLENTPYGSGNVEDVLLTAVSQVFPSIYYTAYPDSTGEYTIQGVYHGIYDVTASLLYDYEDSTIVDVEVEEATNTPNIDFELNCLLGALQGTVIDGYGEPIEGATITALGDLPPSEPYCDTTNDSGYYEINPIIGQFYNFTCEAEGFITVTDTFTVLPDETYVKDVILDNPEIRVEPDSYEVTLAPETQTTRPITVYNDGNAPLEWNSSIELPEALIIDIPSSSGNFPRSKEIISVGLAPINSSSNNSNEPVFDILKGSTAWANDLFTNALVTFDTDVPGTMLCSIPISWHSFAGDFGADNETTMYIIDSDDSYLKKVYIPTGVVTTIGFSSSGYLTWTGLACDKSTGIMYASASDVTISKLYTIDLTTGEATLIGDTGIAALIDIAIDGDGDGDMYGYCIVSDASYMIDKDTGAGTYLGSIGFDAHYAQGMAWDPENDIIYLAAYNNDGSGGQLRVLDTTTGNTAFIGGFPGGDELDVLAFPGSVPPRWLVIDPTSGTVPPGGSQSVTATFDATGLPVGTVKTANILFIPNVGNEDIVFAELIVGSTITGTLDGTVTEIGTTVPIDSVLVRAMPAKVSTYTNSAGYYIFGELGIGTYNLTFEKEGYNVGYVENVEIFEDNTTTVNFSLTQPTMNITPTSISETVPPDEPLAIDIHIVNNGDGELAWDASIIEPPRGVETDYSNCTTGILEAKNGHTNGGNGSNGFVAEENFKDDITLHYDGPNDNAIGLSAGGTFMIAARFTPTELGDYYGDYQLSHVEIFIYNMPTITTLKVWEGGCMGNPDTEIYSEDITGQISQQSWTTIILSTPIDLVFDNEYWVGYEVTHVTGLLPAGCDIGPAVDEKGDWVYLAPGPWDEIQNSGYDVNWNIRAVLSPGITPWITLTHNSGIVEAGGDSTVTVYFNTIDHTIGDTLHATIDFVSTPDVGTTSIPVTITVGNIGVTGEPEILVTELLGNFPNPFSYSTVIQFSLKEDSHVKLSVYNIRGQLVNRLIDEDMAAGIGYQLEWSGASNDKKLANGIYFYKLETGNKTFLKKMILMK